MSNEEPSKKFEIIDTKKIEVPPKKTFRIEGERNSPDEESSEESTQGSDASSEPVLSEEELVDGPSFTEEPQCALCGDRFEIGEQVFRCPVCETMYHADCWKTCGNKCVVLGCPGTEEPGYAEGRTTDEIAESSGQEPLSIHFNNFESSPPPPLENPPEQTTAHVQNRIWDTPQTSAIAATLLMCLMGILYRYTGELLLWSMGADQMHSDSVLSVLYYTGQTSLYWWIPIGAAYGLLHHIFTRGRIREAYRIIRTLLVILYKGISAYLLGHAVFIIEYRWPDILWGLPGKVLWLDSILPYLFGIMALWSIPLLYRTPYTLFFQSLGLYLDFGIIVSAVSKLCALILGLLLACCAWLIGRAISLVWQDTVFHTVWFSKTLTIGGNIGFILGIILATQLLYEWNKHALPAVFED